jgi:hypothetical protein
MWCHAAGLGALGIDPGFEDLDAEVRPLLFHGCPEEITVALAFIAYTKFRSASSEP